jgi:CPA1 family monovalent cation:H+ antiporter
LTLPYLIKRFGISDLENEVLEEATARIRAAEIALKRLEELSNEEWVSANFIERMKLIYEERIRLANRLAGKADHDEEQTRSVTFRRLQKEILNSERRALLQLHYQGGLSNEVMRKILYDIDLEASRLHE